MFYSETEIQTVFNWFESQSRGFQNIIFLDAKWTDRWNAKSTDEKLEELRDIYSRLGHSIFNAHHLSQK